MHDDCVVSIGLLGVRADLHLLVEESVQSKSLSRLYSVVIDVGRGDWYTDVVEGTWRSPAPTLAFAHL